MKFLGSMAVAFGVLVASSVRFADAATGVSASNTSHFMSVAVKDDGSANTLLRVEGLGNDGKGDEYRLILPVGSTGEVKAWYVDNVFIKCIQPYIGQDVPAMEGVQFPCSDSKRTWVEVEAVREGDRVRIILPKTNGELTLGISWTMVDVTSRAWWGRKVTVVTPIVENFVSHTSVAVNFPDGIFIRDKSVGSVRWGDVQAEVFKSQPGIGMDEKTAFVPGMFDRAGEGDVVKDKSNMMPGEQYMFTLFTATDYWKLFVPEIVAMISVSIALAFVVSALLKLIIGRRSFVWYLSIVVLFFLVAGLIIWLLRMYSAFSLRPEYSVMNEVDSSSVGL